MGKRKYPPLKHKEVLEIISNLGFQYKRTVGSHAHYERLERNTRYIVTVARLRSLLGASPATRNLKPKATLTR